MKKKQNDHTRCRFIGSLGAAVTALGMPASLIAAKTDTDAAGNSLAKKTILNPYIYAFRIGDFEAWSISDGYGTFNQGVTKKMWPPAEQPRMTEALVALGERPDDMTLYVNILLLRHGRRSSSSMPVSARTPTQTGVGSPLRWTLSRSTLTMLPTHCSATLTSTTLADSPAKATSSFPMLLFMFSVPNSISGAPRSLIFQRPTAPMTSRV